MISDFNAAFDNDRPIRATTECSPPHPTQASPKGGQIKGIGDRLAASPIKNT